MELTKCRQLVDLASLTGEDIDLWNEAALDTLAGLPLSLLRRGAQHARLHADHPSKIVPCIMREIGDEWRQMQKWAEPKPAPLTTLPAPGEHRCTPDEAKEILRKFGVGSFGKPEHDWRDDRTQSPSVDKDRPCRAPTREDYVRMGVDPAVLDSLDQDKAA